jgi:DNA-binding response OmpR family regulator
MPTQRRATRRAGWVLVADADERVATALAAHLRRRGLGAYVTPQGRDAMRLAAVHPPGLAVVDMRLADMAGTALVALLRRNDSQLPVIVTDAEDHEVQAREHGIVHYARKPVDARALSSVVARVLRR